MGAQLWPLLANIFMISSEDNTLPKLQLHLRYWKRYVDDSFAYVLSDKIDIILHELNSYHLKTKFTSELASYNKLAFLDVSARRTKYKKAETSVYRKASCKNIYINCRSHAPPNCIFIPWGTLDLLLRNKISYLRHIFTEYNDFPLKIVNNIIGQKLQGYQNVDQISR